MKCPNCRAAFQISERTCLHCGIHFQEFYERRAWGTQSKPVKRARPRPRRPLRAPSINAVVALGTGLVISAWAMAARFHGVVLPAGAYCDGLAKLAFMPPPGWKMRTDAGDSRHFHNVAELTRSGSRIAVDVAPEALPVEEHMAELVLEEFNGRHPQLGKPTGVLVAGVDGRRLAFHADGRGAPSVVGEAVFIPGSGRNYLVRFYSNEADIAQRRPDWTAFLASIRMTD